MALLENYEEYSKYAKLMTSLHALPAKRSMPLTASGANAGNTSSAPPSEASTPLEGSPAVKKAKGVSKTANAAQLKAKKSLKRL